VTLMTKVEAGRCLVKTRLLTHLGTWVYVLARKVFTLWLVRKFSQTPGDSIRSLLPSTAKIFHWVRRQEVVGGRLNVPQRKGLRFTL